MANRITYLWLACFSLFSVWAVMLQGATAPQTSCPAPAVLPLVNTAPVLAPESLPVLQPPAPAAAVAEAAPRNPGKKFEKRRFPWRIYPPARRGGASSTNYLEITLYDLIALSLGAVAFVALVVALATGLGVFGWLGMVIALGSLVFELIGCRRPRSLFKIAVVYFALLLAVSLFIAAVFGPSIALVITFVAFVLLGFFFILNWRNFNWPS